MRRAVKICFCPFVSLLDDDDDDGDGGRYGHK